MTIKKYKKNQTRHKSKYVAKEIEGMLNIFYEEIIIKDPLTENTHERFMKYAKLQNISYKDCYQHIRQ